MTVDTRTDLRIGHRRLTVARTVLHAPGRRQVVAQCECGQRFDATCQTWEDAHLIIHCRWRQHAKGGD